MPLKNNFVDKVINNPQGWETIESPTLSGVMEIAAKDKRSVEQGVESNAGYWATYGPYIIVSKALGVLSLKSRKSRDQPSIEPVNTEPMLSE